MNDFNLKIAKQYHFPKINCNSFNYEIFKFLKKIQCNFFIFPNEIISIIMILFTYISIHPNNICECKEVKCINIWKILMKNKKLYQDQHVIHCECNIITDIYSMRCHNIKIMIIKNICCYCKKKICNSCINFKNNEWIIKYNLKPYSICESCFIKNQEKM